MIAVSRCLIGENCTYAGKNNLCKEIKELYDQGLALPLCPEVLGGLPIPRTPCEVTGEKVIDQKGIDRTKEYTQGAKIALDKCLEKRRHIPPDREPHKYHVILRHIGHRRGNGGPGLRIVHFQRTPALPVHPVQIRSGIRLPGRNFI